MDSAKRVNIHIEKAHNFMRQFRDPESRELKKLSANQFMDVWSHYDVDCKYIYCHSKFLVKLTSMFCGGDIDRHRTHDKNC